jgi:hypothetical protein
MFYSTPASDAQSWQRAQYQRAIGSLATNMTQMQAQGQLQGQEQANQAALGFTGQAQNADAQQMEAAIQAGQLGLAGGPTAQTAMYGSAFMPSPDFGSVYPQAFSALGGLFATPQQQNPYSYNPAQAPRGAAGGNAQYRPQQ